MTCCVAAIASGGNAIILVSDKMIGTSNNRGERHGITKGEAIHKDWWALFAGDVSLAGDIFSRLKSHFPDGELSIYDARDALSTTLFEKWQSDTERAYLKKEGYTSETFRDEAPKKMAEEIYHEIRERRLRHSLKAEILVAGFDEQGTAHILSCNGFVGPDQFVPANHDSEGFSAIGSGADGAMWMMSYRDVTRNTKRRDAAYYAVEGIYYAELGSGVGESADLVIIRPNKKALWVGARAVDKTIVPICRKLRPGELNKKHRRKLKRKVRGIKIDTALNVRALSVSKSSFGDILPRRSKESPV
jgi:hypothetical protein